LAQSWPGDAHTLPKPRTSFLDACTRKPGRLRIGLLTEPVIVADVPIDEACLSAAVRTARLLEDLGHQVEPAPVPFSAQRWTSFDVVWSVLSLTAPVPPEAEDLLVPLTRWLRDKARSVTALEYATAINRIQMTTREVAATWAAYDVILAPTLARLPVLIGELRDDEDPAADFAAQMAFTPWTSVWNLTGWPAISLPLEQAQLGQVSLPVGVMLGGKHGAEETLLALSAQLEEARPWRNRRPPTW
jgi:amidase